jgi:hypothetical protein
MALRQLTPETDRRITCLVVGRAGIGKTSLLRTIPADEPVLTVSAESGLLCVQDLLEDGRVSGYEVDSAADVLEILNCLRASAEWREAYRWVFIDSLTELSSRCLEDFKRRHSGDGYKMWDEYSQMMMRIVKGFRDLKGYDVVFTCLETMELDDSKRRIITPDVQMKGVRNRLPALFDEVFWMTDVPDPGDVKLSRRVFCTKPDRYQPGKDRSGKLDVHEPPDLAFVKAKIFKE